METIVSHELDVLYGNRSEDVALLNDSDAILTFADDAPCLPASDEEVFDEAFHSWRTPSSLMEAAKRELDR